MVKVQPDLTALGKMIGGGFPVGAMAGRNDVMEVFNPLAEKVLFRIRDILSEPHHNDGGTCRPRKISITDNMVQKSINWRTWPAVKLPRQSATARDSGMRHGRRMIFRIHIKAAPPKNYRESYVTPDETA